jgi:hypothetical protein
MGHDVGDMVLQSCNQGRIRPGAAGHYYIVSNGNFSMDMRYLTPAWELVMPHQIVASQLLAVGLGKLSNGVSIGEGECILRRLSCIPLSNNCQ